MGKNRAAAGDRAGRAWSFTGDEASKIVGGDEEGCLAMMRRGGCVFVCGRQKNGLWMDGGRQLCVCVAAMDGGRGRGGRDGGYILFCDAMVFGGGGRMVFRGR